MVFFLYLALMSILLRVVQPFRIFDRSDDLKLQLNVHIQNLEVDY